MYIQRISPVHKEKIQYIQHASPVRTHIMTHRSSTYIWYVVCWDWCIGLVCWYVLYVLRGGGGGGGGEVGGALPLLREGVGLEVLEKRYTIFRI